MQDVALHCALKLSRNSIQNWWSSKSEIESPLRKIAKLIFHYSNIHQEFERTFAIFSKCFVRLYF